MSNNEFKEQLLNEWMKENPPFDNDKETFEDFLVRQVKVIDKKNEIESLHSLLKIEILANEKLRREHKSLQLQIENLYSEDEILNVLNKYYTESAPNQHIKQHIIGDLKYDHR